MKKANACYTGGGIYIIQAELEDGTFFTTDTYLFGLYDSDYLEANETIGDLGAWEQEHLLADSLTVAEAKRIEVDALEWILENEPVGNYDAYELRLLLDESRRKLEEVDA